MRWFLIALTLFAPMRASAGEFEGLAAGILAMYSNQAPIPTPIPPAPAPSDQCDNCGGTGKLGDGTIVFDCPECNGTGKKVKAVIPKFVPKPAAPKAVAGHWENRPVRVRVKVCHGSYCTYEWRTQNKRVWIPGTTSTPKVTKAVDSRMGYYPVRRGWWSGCGSWKHLTVGEHRGKYDPAYLQSLSWAELQSLHSDDHEHRVKRQFVIYAS